MDNLKYEYDNGHLQNTFINNGNVQLNYDNIVNNGHITCKYIYNIVMMFIFII